MAGEKIHTDWDTMRTDDPKVFAAGDGAFGPSTIVKAMYHGHRAAYYVKHFLEGDESPLPYRTPFKTRRVPVAQDALWEVFPREDQEFHGLGENPVAFPEIEYDVRRGVGAARGGALLPLRRRDGLGRLQRAHARGHLRHGADEARRTRASSAPSSRAGSRSPTRRTSARRWRRSTTSSSCPRTSRGSSSTRIATHAGSRRRSAPASRCGRRSSSAGFDDAPDEVRRAVAHGVEAQGLAYVGPPRDRRRASRGSRSSRTGTTPRPRGGRADLAVRTAARRRPNARTRRSAPRPRRCCGRPAGGDPVRARARLRRAAARGNAGRRGRLARARRPAGSVGAPRRDQDHARPEPRGGPRRCSTSAASARAPTPPS